MDVLQVLPGVTGVPPSAVGAERLVAFVRRNRDHLAPYLPAVAALDTLSVVERHLVDVTERIARRELWEWHLLAEEHLCGAVRLNWVEPENRKLSIAYYVGSDYQGRGLATVAARAAITFAFRSLQMNRIELRCVVENRASVRVAERLGFFREGELREAEFLAGRYANHYVFSLLRSEFEARGGYG